MKEFFTIYIPSYFSEGTIYETIQSSNLPNELVGKLEHIFRKPDFSGSRLSLASVVSTCNETVNSINSNKKIAIELAFKKLKKDTNMGVRQLIRAVNDSLNPNISKDIFESLLRQFPTEQELEPYQNISSSSNFGDADLFCFLISREAGFKFLIELIVAKNDVKADVSSLDLFYIFSN